MTRPTLDAMKLKRDGWLNPGTPPPMHPWQRDAAIVRAFLILLREARPDVARAPRREGEQ